MNLKKLALLASLLFAVFGMSTISAQAFFASRAQGTFELKFLPPTNGQVVALSIDDQPAGNLPLTVYVVPGLHRFTVTPSGGSSTTVALPINADTVVPYLGARKEYPLTVTVSPPGASLAVDGRPFGGNTVNLTAGNHTLSANAAGFQNLSIPFTMPAGAHNLTLTLVSNTFPLTLTVNPPTATLAVDGVPVSGNTVNTTPGTHNLTAAAPGFQSLVIPFTMPSAAHQLNLTLIANTFPLTVLMNPPTAVLNIDGVPVTGNQVGVTPGAHSLTATAPGFQDLVIPFNMPSAAQQLNLTLIALGGTLQVNTDSLFPKGTAYKLFVDGKEVKGHSLTLSAGTHAVRIAAGVLVLETTVSIGSGQNLTLVPAIQWSLR